MCLFPIGNSRVDGAAGKKGILEFPCGACPECMVSRANKIVLRDVFEASQHEFNCMCTLTYDTYIRDEQGKIIGEKVNLRRVDVRDCQLFIKRMRQYVFRHYGVTFKYRLSAEYGKKTHRPHYHVLFFGWTFPDAVFYKKSKRGNRIYTSAILTKLWRHGICTVDSLRVTPATARYCSKYSAKNLGVEDTFSLCSNGIGLEALYQNFNGLYYVVEGRKYAIPREIWQRYITECYDGKYHFTTKYLNRNERTIADGSFRRNARLRKAYRIIRDHDPSYIAYIQYWQKQSDTFKRLLPSRFQRILALPEDKFHFYKTAALQILHKRHIGVPAVAPRSNCSFAYGRYLFDYRIAVHLPVPSRLNRASDTFFGGLTREEFISGNVCPGYGKNPFNAT